MFQTLKNAWKTKELRKKILFMFFIVFVFRLGNNITVPNVDASVISNLAGQGNLIGLYDLFSGGALSKFSLFALGVVPYINASIIIQLLTVAITPLEELSKEGDSGRKKIQNWTRILGLIIGAVMAYASYITMFNAGAIKDSGYTTLALIILILVAGTAFLMWLGDQITQFGIGNGTSVLIFINIISRLPVTAKQFLTTNSTTDIITTILILSVFVGLFIGVVYFSLAERRIPVQYAGRVVNGKTMKSQTQHLPISVSSSAVIAIIFALSVIETPNTLHTIFPNASIWNWMATSEMWFNPFNQKNIAYIIFEAFLVIFFTWFYTEITLKPDEMSENMQKAGGFVNGVKPGVATTEYLEGVLSRISAYAGVFAAIIAVFPIILRRLAPAYGNMNFGGTVLFIVIGVAIDTLRSLESQLMTRHYKGFLKR